jgi:hypothetical protein
MALKFKSQKPIRSDTAPAGPGKRVPVFGCAGGSSPNANFVEVDSVLVTPPTRVCKRVIREEGHAFFMPYFGEVDLILWQADLVAFLSSSGLPVVLQPDEVDGVVLRLFSEYRRVELRMARISTTENLKHVEQLRNRVDALLRTWKEPRTAMICRDADDGTMDTSLRGAHTYGDLIKSVELLKARFDCVKEELEWETEREFSKGGSALEEFVKGPLANAYTRLYGQAPPKTGRATGPFPRFGERFFTLVGHPVERSTIASALKGRASK